MGRDKQKRRKLRLKKQTIRRLETLSPDELGQAAGGTEHYMVGPTFACAGDRNFAARPGTISFGCTGD